MPDPFFISWTLREFDGKEAPKKFLQELSKEKNGLYGNDAEPDDRKNPCSPGMYSPCSAYPAMAFILRAWPVLREITPRAAFRMDGAQR